MKRERKKNKQTKNYLKIQMLEDLNINNLVKNQVSENEKLFTKLQMICRVLFSKVKLVKNPSLKCKEIFHWLIFSETL